MSRGKAQTGALAPDHASPPRRWCASRSASRDTSSPAWLATLLVIDVDGILGTHG
jgi:hypothetical protein